MKKKIEKKKRGRDKKPRKKKVNHPRAEVFFELWGVSSVKGKKGFTSKDLEGKITNKSFRDANKYCKDLVKFGFLRLKKEKRKRKGKFLITKDLNIYSIKWNNYTREIIRLILDEEVFIEPDKKTIKSVKKVLKSLKKILKYEEDSKGYDTLRKVYSGKRFFEEIFNPKLLNKKNINNDLKEAIKNLEELKEKNREFEKNVKEEYCRESKIPKNYLINYLKTN
jgi:flagellin-specific chaperone FliS